MHKKLKYKSNNFFIDMFYCQKKKKTYRSLKNTEKKKLCNVVTTMTINSGMDLLPVTPCAPGQSNKEPLNKTTKRVLVV